MYTLKGKVYGVQAILAYLALIPESLCNHELFAVCCHWCGHHCCPWTVLLATILIIETTYHAYIWMYAPRITHKKNIYSILKNKNINMKGMMARTSKIRILIRMLFHRIIIIFDMQISTFI